MKLMASLAVVTALSGLTDLQDLFVRYEFNQNLMGTRFRIVLYAKHQDQASSSARAAFHRIDELNNKFSDYRDDSELNQICRSAASQNVPVSRDMFRILSLSQEWARATEGAFDITAGPIIKLWRRARRKRELPDSRDLDAALSLTGFRKLHLSEINRSVRLEKDRMQLDLGGIAKGFAADEAMKVLNDYGIRSALIAAGGDIVVSDAPPGTMGWTIGISPASAGPIRELPTLLLNNAAVSTSGDAEQFLVIDGKRHSHIVDPATGIGIIDAATVTVVSANGTTSDAAATALSVLGPQKGLDLLNSTGLKDKYIAALFIQIQDGIAHLTESPKWKSVPRAPNSDTDKKVPKDKGEK